MPTSKPDRNRESRRIFVVTPGFESALRAELSSIFRPAPAPPGGGQSGPGGAAGLAGLVLVSETQPPIGPTDPVFARQQLPSAVEIFAPSVSGLAEACYGAVQAAVDLAQGPFTIHAFAPTGAEPALSSRATLIASELLVRLRERRRRAARIYRSPEDLAAAFGDAKLLIQILLIERDRVWVSAAAPQRLARGGWDVAPWPGGVAPVADDRRPPSRAYRKLEEAFLWMGEEPHQDELCVDLGGAPGGWAYTALRRGTRVIAVDRAPLHAPILGDPRLTMIEGNAFTYEPPAPRVPVDWLLSDVICEPARALALIDRWLTPGWCRRLVVTVKFKGQDGYGILADVRATLERAGCTRLRIKHLHHNKNEVTVMATAGPVPSVAAIPGHAR
jgi:FtsJ-like methyltransferase